jgi:hypothetical protein
MPTSITTPTHGSTPSVGALTVMGSQIMIFNGHLWVPLVSIQEEDGMVEFNVAYKAHNVNSKRLLQQIVGTVEESSREFIIQRSLAYTRTYDYEQLVDYLDAYFDELCEDKVVNKYDIIGDFRNNQNDQVRQGVINVDVKFQQFNCLNITRVLFTFTKV